MSQVTPQTGEEHRIGPSADANQSPSYILPAPIVHFSPKATFNRSEDDEGCFAMTWEKKYYNVEGPSSKFVMTRILRAHELQYNGVGRLIVLYLSIARAKNEVAAIEFVRKHTTLPVPEVVLTFLEDGALYTILKHVEGVSMSALPEEQARIVCRLLDQYASQLAHFRSDIIRNFVDEPYFLLHLSEALQTGDIPLEYKRSAESSYMLCHGDFARQNVIVNPDTLEVMALIDWERAGFYPSEVEEYYYFSPSAVDCKFGSCHRRGYLDLWKRYADRNAGRLYDTIQLSDVILVLSIWSGPRWSVLRAGRRVRSLGSKDFIGPTRTPEETLHSMVRLLPPFPTRTSRYSFPTPVSSASTKSLLSSRSSKVLVGECIIGPLKRSPKDKLSGTALPELQDWRLLTGP